MKRFLLFLVCFIFFVISSSFLICEVRPIQTPNYNSQFFIENKGQWDSQVKYLAKLNGMNYWITNTGMVLDYYRIERDAREFLEDGSPNHEAGHITKMWGHVIKSTIIGNKSGSTFLANDKKETYYNYLLGNDPNKWASFVPLFSFVTQKNAYEGIDIKYYYDDNSIRYDFIINPGSDPKQIKLQYEGQNSLRINEKGELVFETSVGSVEHNRLFAYQNTNGTEVNQIDCKFTNLGNGLVSVDVGNYDKSKPLIIDPYLYGTFLGGTSSDHPHSVTSDVSGNAIVGGSTSSSNFPVTTGAYDLIWNSTDTFVSKFNTTGTGLIFSTFIGGTSSEYCYEIDVDANGYIYTGGYTYSSNYPVTSGCYDNTYNSTDGYLTKLNPSGSGLIYSTYFGGTSSEYCYAIDVDANGYAYATGYTSSSNFPVTSGCYDNTYNSTDIYLLKLNTTGSALVFSTYLGGTSSEYGYAVTVDQLGYPTVAGYTNSSNYPTTSGCWDNSYNSTDIVVTKFNLNGTGLIFSTYLGGTSSEYGNAIESDANNNIFVGGYTNSSNYPLSSGVIDNYYYSSEGIITKFSPTGSLQFSTYLGGNNSDYIRGIALDSDNNILVSGYTYSSDFAITADAFQYNLNSGPDAFLTKISPTGTLVIYSSYLGGTSSDLGYLHSCISSDNNNGAIVVGFTSSSNFPVTSGAYDVVWNSTDGFVSRFSFEPPDVQFDTLHVTIGTQTWMKKNLDVAYYRNGDVIPQVTDSIQWGNLTTGAWCYYNNDPANGAIYGKLYNCYAVNDPRGLAPQGFHIPSNDEWQVLESNGGQHSEKLLDTNSFGCSPTNETGFTAFPGGCRYKSSDFGEIPFRLAHYWGFWWTSTKSGQSDYNIRRTLMSNSCRPLYDEELEFMVSFKESPINGFSVRCLKDETTKISFPSLTLSKSIVKEGDTLKISGEGFTKNSKVFLTISSPDFTQKLDSITAGIHSKFSYLFPINESTKPGIYSVFASDTGKQISTNPKKFEVTKAFLYQDTIILSIVAKPYSIGEVLKFDWYDSTFIRKPSDLLRLNPEKTMLWRNYEVQYSLDNGKTWKLADTASILARLNILNRFTSFLDLSESYLGDVSLRIRDIDYGVIQMVESKKASNYIQADYEGRFSNIESVKVSKNPAVTFEWCVPKQITQDNKRYKPVGVASDGASPIIIRVTIPKKDKNNIQSLYLNLSDSYSGANTYVELGYLINRKEYNSLIYKELNVSNEKKKTSAIAKGNGSEYYDFWYVAPEYFDVDPSLSKKSNRIVSVTTNIKLIGGNNLCDDIATNLEIYRPPLLLVHGLNSDADMWSIYSNYLSKSGNYIQQEGVYGNVENIFKPYIGRGKDNLQKSSETLLENGFHWSYSYMNERGISAIKFDYISHSMGSLMLRKLIDSNKKEFNSINYNLNQGFVHKMISIDSPHNGSYFANLLIDFCSDFNNKYRFDYLSRYNTWEIAKYGVSLSKLGIIKDKDYFIFPCDAIKDLTVGGTNNKFGKTDLNNHLIASDIIYNHKNDVNYINNIPNGFWGYLMDFGVSDLVSVMKNINYRNVPYINGRNMFNDLTNLQRALTKLPSTPDWIWSTDLVVGTKSQLAGGTFDLNSSDLTKKCFAGYGHTMITSVTEQPEVFAHLDLLLKTNQINKYFSKSIPGTDFSKPLIKEKENDNRIQDNEPVLAFDSININLTVNKTNAFVNDILEVTLSIPDTTGFQYGYVQFQGQEINLDSARNTQKFNIAVSGITLDTNQVFAFCRFAIGDTLFNSYKVLKVNIITNEQLFDFKADKDQIDLFVDDEINLNFSATYETFIADVKPETNNIQFEIGNNSIVNYLDSTNEFIALKPGSTVVIAKYKNLSDTIYFYVEELSIQPEITIKTIDKPNPKLNDTIRIDYSLTGEFSENSKLYSMVYDSTNLDVIYLDSIQNKDISFYKMLISPKFIPNTKYYVQLYSNEPVSYSNIDSFMVVNYAKSIEITGFNRNRLFENEQYQITWNSQNVENVNIFYSIDNGQNWLLINNEPVNAIAGKYDWKVPVTYSKTCLLKIVDKYDLNIFSISKVFEISKVVPLTPNLVDKEGCENVPISIGIENIANLGGSDVYEFNWSPSSGIDNPKIANPKVINPLSDSTEYILNLKDVITGNTAIDSMKLSVESKVIIKMLKAKTFNMDTLINLYDLILEPVFSAKYTYTWKKGENKIELYSPTAEKISKGITKYYLTVVPNSGCPGAEDSITIVGEEPGSVSEDNEFIFGKNGNSYMKIYPNPTNEKLNIFAAFSEKTTAKMEMFDIIGNKIMTKTYSEDSSIDDVLELDKIPAGVYQIILTTNFDVLMTKFVKN
ncbi:MAG: hypothetical protein A2X64_00010 [Ignavibacteria bacterium GWF2_33_9]|nr:MAG: hypothetical protein A2X64_00010 [Ignavibacteria bacterium GWF2_33_9]